MQAEWIDAGEVISNSERATASSLRTQYERLSIHDQSNLWAEAADTPMHIIAVLQLEPAPLVDVQGNLEMAEICGGISRRLDRAPRLRQIVRPGGVLTGPPVWIDEVGFDLNRHVRAGTIPAPGDEAELLKVVAWIDQQRLDRSHALWQLWLLTGLSSGRVVMVLKLHHAIADGLAAVQLLASLFDSGADCRGDDSPVRPWQPQKPPGRWSLMRENAATKARKLTRGFGSIPRPVAAGELEERCSTPYASCWRTRDVRLVARSIIRSGHTAGWRSSGFRLTTPKPSLTPMPVRSTI